GQFGRDAGQRELAPPDHAEQLVAGLAVRRLQVAGVPTVGRGPAPHQHGDATARPHDRNGRLDDLGPVGQRLGTDVVEVTGHERAHEVVQQRGRTRGGADLGCRPHPLLLGVGDPQHQIAERQVRDDLPVGHQRLQPVDLRLGERGLGVGDVFEGGHVPSLDRTTNRLAGNLRHMTDDQQLPEPAGPHGGHHALDVARAHGVTTMFTLSGAHIFPMYDAAVKTDRPMPIIDVRHEPSAVFAAEAVGKLTRTPGLAVLTAGPGVTNGVSPVAQAYFSGAPLVVVGGRAAASTWGQGTLQELDHPPIFETITKKATTAATLADIAPTVDEAFTLAGSSHRGPTFVDIPMDEFFNSGPVTHTSAGPSTERLEPDPDAIAAIARLLVEARHPVVVLGTDVWADHAEDAARRFVEETG